MQRHVAKPIVAILTGYTNLRDEIITLLQKNLGAADYIGEWHSFRHTKYYEPEMGEELKRCLISFETLISPDLLPKLKSWTREIEDHFRVNGKRNVNLDPGYVDYHKVVLASGKGGGHMIMLTPDVFVDMLLWYNKGWQFFPWAYPDFRDGTYFVDLNKIRNMLKSHYKPAAIGKI